MSNIWVNDLKTLLKYDIASAIETVCVKVLKELYILDKDSVKFNVWVRVLNKEESLNKASVKFKVCDKPLRLLDRTDVKSAIEKDWDSIANLP